MNLYSDWFKSKSTRTKHGRAVVRRARPVRPTRKEVPQFKVTIRHGNGVAPHRVVESELCWNKVRAQEIGYGACLRLAPVLGCAVYWSFKYFPSIRLLSERKKVRVNPTRRIRK